LRHTADRGESHSVGTAKPDSDLGHYSASSVIHWIGRGS